MLRARRPRRAVWPSDRTVDVRSTRDAAPTAGTVELPAEVFDVQVNIPLIHQVVVAQLAAARQGTHATKTRGEVRGGGKKPYRQKGTGRARQGSTRAPQFAGGGVVHGPPPRDYAQRTPKKMKAAALRGALSDRARDGRVHVVTGLVDGDAPSTKAARRWPCRQPHRAQARARGASSATTSRPGRACATPSVHLLAPTSSTPTTCWSATTWSSPRRARRVPRRPAQGHRASRRPRPIEATSRAAASRSRRRAEARQDGATEADDVTADAEARPTTPRQRGGGDK